jgi:hypothetical protein
MWGYRDFIEMVYCTGMLSILRDPFPFVCIIAAASKRSQLHGDDPSTYRTSPRSMRLRREYP